MTLLSGPEDVLERRDIVVRLYQIVLGRLPDAAGLSHYLSEPGGGSWQRDVAARLLASDEFSNTVGSEGPIARLLRNAHAHSPEQQSHTASPVDLVCELAGRGDVVERLSALRVRYPGGVSIDDQEMYRLWLAERRATRARAIRRSPAAAGPLLSVLVWGSDDGEALGTSLASIASQSESRIDILVAVDRPPDGATQALCDAYAALRVRFVRARFGRSVAAALNKAARVAQAAFVCLLRSGDGLDEAAVAELAPAMDHADVLLSDSDSIQNGAGRGEAAVTGGWDAEAALASPPHGLVVIRTALLHAIGGFRPVADGEQAWDVLLRSSTAVNAARIRHLPVVLLHRAQRDRAATGRTVGRDIVRFHLDRTGRPDCRIDGDGLSEPIRVVYPLPAAAPVASVIIATRDRAALLRKCLDGLFRRTVYPAFEVMILDNDSREPDTAQLLRDASGDPRVRVLSHAGPFNWSELNNTAVQHMRGDVAVLLNNDTDVIEPNWLRELVTQAVRPSVGVVGAKLLYPDRTIQHAGIGMGPGCQSIHLWRHADGVAPGYLDQLRIVRSVAAVTGACLAVRRNVFLEVGGLDQEHLRVTWSDTDLCMRVRAAGYTVVWTPHALLYHIELATRGSDDTPEARPRFSRESAHFRALWGGFADHDPYFSPNLVMERATPWLKTVFDDTASTFPPPPR